METTEQPTLDSRRNYLLMETVAMLSADLYKSIYESIDGSFGDVCQIIIDLATEFEDELNWVENSDHLDYLVELNKFEEKVMKRMQLK